MDTRPASPASPQNESKNSNASKLPQIPPLDMDSSPGRFDSVLRNLTPKDLALVAAGLSRGGELDDKMATQLIKDACILLKRAESRLMFVSPPGPAMFGPPATATRVISGASFLRKSLPGSGPIYTERRREFIRRVILYREQNGAEEVQQRSENQIDIDKSLNDFKKTQLNDNYRQVCESIVAQIKGSPEAKEKQRRARQKGGRARAAQQLTQHLKNNDGWAHFDTLIRDRKYTHNTVDQLISEFPEEFETFERHGLRAVRLKPRI